MERSVTQIALFAALIAVLGLVPQITLISGVPITAQSLGVMLCGTVLGARKGALAVLLFLLLVMLGLPLLSGGRGGIGVLAGPTVGFIVGFPVAAFLAGLVVEKWRAPVGVAAFAGSVLGGIVAMYACGTVGMALVLDKTLPEAALLNTPFLAGDLIKTVLAGLITNGLARVRPGALLSRP
ncbi:MAG: biotin transporter BioY [Cereibacter changlensis]|jgi:biotin transport system substrate-specific component|uniref:Biotin transporter n=2 Tax=Cereibacter changlensis TaxID=402884 RepID=A0A2T4JYB6_9RHOB|nr:biotin transporter BioY [Cereibacter changlensis]MBZ4690387.1 BioY protein precursor [Cereibacter sp.]PTE22904.1 BioY family transporter [Cereibacter changlensis JA139]PZX55270.1 biotin transport system substrate-specific component [Cereibacter changlensis]TKA95400.1 BioY family transporter [Cereibacter changlensis]